jgi:hypothetical protein
MEQIYPKVPLVWSSHSYILGVLSMEKYSVDTHLDEWRGTMEPFPDMKKIK